MSDLISLDSLKSDENFLQFITDLYNNSSITKHIKNLDECKKIAKYVSYYSVQYEDKDISKPSHLLVEMAINELLINAVEHGMLSIDYNEKTELLNNQQWNDAYIAKLLSQLPDDKFVTMNFTLNKETKHISVSIKDPGPGFKFNTTTNSDKLLPYHGRGCKLAMSILENMEYHGNGNEVKFKVSVDLDLLKKAVNSEKRSEPTEKAVIFSTINHDGSANDIKLSDEVKNKLKK